MTPPVAIENAYIIGQDNFDAWADDYNAEGYLKVLPQHEETVAFKDPYKQWQLDHQNGAYKEEGTYPEGGKSVYYSSWGPDDVLEVILDMQYLSQLEIEGFGILEAGDGFIPWFKDAQGNEEKTAYEFLRAYNGLIPGPLLVADPGDTIKIILKNNLKPSSETPSAPEQVTNLHTHGLHVSPVGAGDNVLITVESGDTREITIKLPDNHAIGLDWYHPHQHGVTSEQVASGLGGLLQINAPYDLPDLENFDPTTEPIYNLAINSFGIQQQLRTPKAGDPLNSSPDGLEVPAGTPLLEIEEGVYTLSNAVFGGLNAKPISYNPDKPAGNPVFDPALRSSEYGGGGLAEPVENVIHTVNGQYNPTIDLETGKWSLFNFANMSINSFHIIQLVHEDNQGNLTLEEVTLVSIDGNASGIVESSRREVTEFPVLAPGARVSIQHAFTKPGKYYFLSNGTDEILNEEDVSDLIKGKKGFVDGHLIWGSQVLATVDVTGDDITPEELPPFPTPYSILEEESEEIKKIVAAAENGDVDRTRTFTWNANAGTAIITGRIPKDTEVKSFEGAYRINGEFYSTKPGESMPPLAMPMLNTLETWKVVNSSGLPDPNLPKEINIPLSEWHPFHIHQNDFAVIKINGFNVKDIVGNYLPEVLSDIINLPPAYVQGTATLENPYGTPYDDRNPDHKGKGVASEVEIVMNFQDFPGSYVNHCHILFHEDAGMMAVLRVILNTEDTWMGLGVDDKDAKGEIELFRASDYEQSITFTPYGKNFKEGIDLAIADVNYKSKDDEENKNVTDNVTDVVTIQRSLEKTSDKFTVKVFDGQGLKEAQEDDQEVNPDDEEILLQQITPFQGITATKDQIASVASGDIDGDGFADIIVGLGGGVAPIIEIYSGKDYELMSRISAFHHETFTGKINLAVGDVNGDNYEDIIVGQGEGGRGLVEVFSGILIQSEGSLVGKDTAHDTALLTKEFQPYGPNYTGEVDVTSGYVLQRPDTPNGLPVQTNNANLTTLAKGEISDDYEQIQVFTYQGGGHGEDHSSSSEEEELRLDVSLTPTGNTQEILGTFADLEGLDRGEPVLLTRKENGQYEIIHLGDENVPESVIFGEAKNQGEEPEEEVTEIIKDKDDKDVFTIKGGVNGKVKIKISIEEYSSSFTNELAVFFVDDENGFINGIAPGASGYTEAALTRARVVFSSVGNRPNGFSLDSLSSLLEFDSDVKVRFMSINNSTLESVISGFTSISEVLFSESYQTIESLTSGEFSLKWKDKSDKSSFKLKIKATSESYIKGSRLQAELGREILDFDEKVTAEFKVYREASYNNFVGFYRIANENGDIDVNDDKVVDFRPGDAGYLQAAVNMYLQQIRLTVSNQGEATYQGNFDQGMFAPFIIADASIEDVLDGGDIPPVYFAFLGANPGKADHIRLLGNNCFGFEDLPNGESDRDYNDVIVQVNVNVNVNVA